MIRNLLAVLLCFSMLTWPGKAKTPPADTFTQGTFPIIEIGKKPSGAVRIASFNVRCADVNGVLVEQRKTIVRKQIRHLKADSVGLQEVTDEWAKDLRRLLCYRMVGEGRDGGCGEGCQILYNALRYQCVDSGTFWLSDTPEVPSFGWDAACRRVCTWALLKNRFTDERYVHVNTHLDHQGAVAVKEGAKMVSGFIAERFGDVPVVFTADLNATPESKAYRILTKNLTDTRRTAPDKHEYGTFHGTQPETHADHYIDTVLCSPEWSVRCYRTVTAGENGRFVSDHFPIYADLNLNQSQK